MSKVIKEAAQSYAPVSDAPHYFVGSVKGKRYGPFEPGTLREAIYRVYSRERSSGTAKTYRVSWNHKKAPYGFMVEFGTARAPAHPFMTPAFGHIREAIDAGKTRMAERLRDFTAKGKQ